MVYKWVDYETSENWIDECSVCYRVFNLCKVDFSVIIYRFETQPYSASFILPLARASYLDILLTRSANSWTRATGGWVRSKTELRFCCELASGISFKIMGKLFLLIWFFILPLVNLGQISALATLMIRPFERQLFNFYMYVCVGLLIENTRMNHTLTTMTSILTYQVFRVLYNHRKRSCLLKEIFTRSENEENLGCSLERITYLKVGTLWSNVWNKSTFRPDAGLFINLVH